MTSGSRNASREVGLHRGVQANDDNVCVTATKRVTSVSHDASREVGLCRGVQANDNSVCATTTVKGAKKLFKTQI